MSKGKLPRPLAEHLLGMQEEIEERRKQAEAETVAAYGLLLHILLEHPSEHEIRYSEDMQYKQYFDLIQSRYDALVSDDREDPERMV